MAVPILPNAYFIMIRTYLALSQLEHLLNGPTCPAARKVIHTSEKCNMPRWFSEVPPTGPTAGGNGRQLCVKLHNLVQCPVVRYGCLLSLPSPNYGCGLYNPTGHQLLDLRIVITLSKQICCGGSALGAGLATTIDFK
jgi:hypothetical protein